ncbi:MAG: hypothetical protein JNM72_05695 [Deltaproteobacteria bacterium]|nr:hypothetical protein [Deltaproteobacteria bacterium]
MSAVSEAVLAQYYRNLTPKVEELPIGLDVSVDLYPPELYPESPVDVLLRGINWNGRKSAQLFSGFRGTGKSTALRQLKARLESQDAYVLLIDALEFINPTTPIDVSDFMLVVAGAFGEACGYSESFWTKAMGLFQRLNLTGLELGEGVKLQVALRTDPTFRGKFHQLMAGHITALVQEAQLYVEGVLAQLRKGDPNRQVVLIIDSLEQLRGTSANANQVAESVESLFVGFANQLHFQNLHVIYSVPPWLRVKSPGIRRLYDGYEQLPCVPVRTPSRETQPIALDLMEQVLAKRGNWQAVLGGDRGLIDQLALASGGYLRDLLQLMRSTLGNLRNGRLGPKEAVQLAVDQLRDHYAGATLTDLRLLGVVRQTGDINAAADQGIDRLGSLFDQMLILNYVQHAGVRHEWYDVHPAILPKVEALARAQA